MGLTGWRTPTIKGASPLPPMPHAPVAGSAGQVVFGVGIMGAGSAGPIRGHLEYGIAAPAAGSAGAAEDVEMAPAIGSAGQGGGGTRFSR